MSWRSKSYEVLPALDVRGAQLRHSLRTVTLAWMFGVVWMTCISGSQVSIFARMLGFDDFEFGLLAAIPFLATFGQLLAAVVIERTGLRKRLFLQCATFHRLLWLAVAAIPLVLPAPSVWSVWAFLGILFISSLSASVAVPGWMTWMGDLVPRRIRGRYFAKRQLYARPVMIVVTLGLGVLLDVTTVGQEGHETAASQPLLLWTICGIFAVSAIFGAIDILLFRRVRELRPRSEQTTDSEKKVIGLRSLLLDPLKDSMFRSYVAYGAVLMFSMTVPGWFMWLNVLNNLGFSKLGANLLFLVIGPILGLAGATLWGRLIDRWGRRPVLLLGTFGTTLSMLPWFFVTHETPAPAFVAEALNWLSLAVSRPFGGHWLLVTPDTPLGAYLFGSLGCVIGGISWTGIALAQTGIVLGFSEKHGSSKYVASSAVLINIGGFVGGLVGGAVAQGLDFLQDSPIIVGPFLWNNWHATFALSWLARMAAVIFLIRMPDPGAGRFRHMVRSMTINAYTSMSGIFFHPMRTVNAFRSQRQNNRARGRKFNDRKK